MSNFLAVATVTAALTEFIQAAVGPDVGSATVTTVRPDAGTGTPATSVNVYLYQVTPNAALGNMDQPTRRGNGELVQRPQAALDLHYLLTFLGDEGKLEPQRLLGSVVRAFHGRSVLTRDLIRQTIAKTKFDYLATSNLADSVELVKFTPLALSLEDLSKLWSVYFQTPYNLSIAYQATVVLIESEVSTQSALPVRARNIYVAPFRQPIVETISSDAGTNEPIVSTSTLIVAGKQLRGDITRISIGEVEIVPALPNISDTRITVKLPAGLHAGVQGLQVVQPRLIGIPPVAHAGTQSNLAAFVLHPTINRKLDTTPDVAVSPVTIAGDGTRSANLTMKLTPSVTKKQRAVLLLNELNPPATRPAFAFSFDSAAHNRPADPAETDTLVFPFSRVAAGDYLMRVQIDGADSPLEQSTDVNNPVFVGPKVTIP